MKAFSFTGLLAGLFLTVISVDIANAAPQALALVDSEGEVALQCREGECAATFSAFCLQKSRSMPAIGTAYEFADTAHVRLVGIRADGGRVELPAARELRVSSLRRQIAVRVALPKARLDALDLRAAVVEIGRNVTLLPKAVAGDANPLSESEIALATGPLRQVGTRVVDRDRNRIGAARWVLQLSDGLPRTGALAPPARGRFLDRARTASAKSSLPAAARERARVILNVCQVKTELGAYDGLRQCFERQHDTLLWRLNVDYWLATNYGS